MTIPTIFASPPQPPEIVFGLNVFVALFASVIVPFVFISVWRSYRSYFQQSARRRYAYRRRRNGSARAADTTLKSLRLGRADTTERAVDDGEV